MFRRVDSLLVTPFLDISHACCVKLSSALVSWQQPLLLTVSRESRDGTINASTNDNGIHRHEHFSRRLSSISRSLRISALSSISAALSLPLSLSLSTTFHVYLIPRYLPHCLFHLDAPLHSLHYIPLLGTVTYPLATGACARGMHSRRGNAVERCNDRREFRA